MLGLPEYQQAECIAVYAPLHHETDTIMLVEAAFSAGKRVLYPAVCGNSMVLRQITALEHLSTGTFGILEPCANGVDHQADEADLIVVPGVAFDRDGHRVGYGKGFYDRFLDHPQLKACLIGLCHDFQVVETLLPAEAHDIRLDLIVTDKRIICCRSNRNHSSGPDSYKGGR